MADFVGLIAFLFGLFVPPAVGEPSLFDNILTAIIQMLQSIPMPG